MTVNRQSKPAFSQSWSLVLAQSIQLRPAQTSPIKSSLALLGAGVNYKGTHWLSGCWLPMTTAVHNTRARAGSAVLEVEQGCDRNTDSADLSVDLLVDSAGGLLSGITRDSDKQPQLTLSVCPERTHTCRNSVAGSVSHTTQCSRHT